MFSEEKNKNQNSSPTFGEDAFAMNPNSAAGTRYQRGSASSRKKASALPAVVLLLAALIGVFVFSKMKHEHVWIEPTCTSPRTCESCGETEGASLEHNWQPATSFVPSRCASCGAMTGRSLGYPLVRCENLEDTNVPGSTKDVGVGDWADIYGSVYANSLRFWVADFGDWSEDEYIRYNLGGQFAELDLTIAMEENSKANTRSKILVYGGTDLLYESDWISDAVPMIQTTVAISGYEELTILCLTDSPDFHYCIVSAMLYN